MVCRSPCLGHSLGYLSCTQAASRANGDKKDTFLILWSRKTGSWEEQLPYVVLSSSLSLLTSRDNVRFWDGKKNPTISSWDLKDFYLRCWHIDWFCEAMSLFLNSIDRKQQMAKLLANAFILWFIFTKTLLHWHEQCHFLVMFGISPLGHQFPGITRW